MSSLYTREQLKLSVAKMCSTIGWHTTMTTPIELLTDILCNYLSQLGKLTCDYANGFGLNEAGIEHLALAFKDFHVNLLDLTDFVRNVECFESPVAVPLYPVPREDHLNFLKPGSKEVVTRQVHIHEHLPPMFPQLEEENAARGSTQTETAEQPVTVESTDSIFKRPAEVPQDAFKRPRVLSEEELGRPTREISSVMMTTSGFLSPAREGRLPDSRTPAIALEPSVPILPPEQAEPVKKPLKSFKKANKSKDNNLREIFKPYKDAPSNKHAHQLKNMMRHKTKNHGHNNPSTSQLPAKNYMVVQDSKSDVPSRKKFGPENDHQLKFNKALAAARMKTEKFNTTITPISSRSIPATIVRPPPLVDKLFTEPDKKKVDILKKISVKYDRTDKNNRTKDEHKLDVRAPSPNLVIEEPGNTSASSHRNLPKDITIELVHQFNPPSVTTVMPSKKSPEKSDKFDKYYFDDYSPPGTPSTPRTPEMVHHSPPLSKSDKKSKSKHKKIHKYSSPSGIDLDVADVELERPKTPDSTIIMKTEKRRHPIVPPMHFPFFTPFSGPGLIPPLTNPLFPHIPIPQLGLPNFGQPSYIPPIHSSMPMNFMPPPRNPILPASTITAPPSAAVATAVSTSASTLSVECSSSTTVTSTITKDDYDVQPSSSTTPDRNIPPVARIIDDDTPSTSNIYGKVKEHKRDKKDKPKKKNKKDKHNKSEKRKLKEEKKEKSRIKKEKKEMKKKLQNEENLQIVHSSRTDQSRQRDQSGQVGQTQNGSTSPVPKLTLKLLTKARLNIKPLMRSNERKEPQPSTSKTPDYIPPREMSPELARFSALITGQPKSKNHSHTVVSSTSTFTDTFPTSSTDSINMKKTITPKVRTREIPVAPPYVVEPSASCYTDSDGEKVWICPGCGVQDDGTPMIGCDDCDAWYHWVCVGIQVPPDHNEDWYCRHCIGRNLLKREKKKKRKSGEKRGRKH